MKKQFITLIALAFIPLFTFAAEQSPAKNSQKATTEQAANLAAGSATDSKPAMITVKATEFKNQFDEAASLTTETKWVLFSADKNVSDLVNKQIEDLKMIDLSQHHGLYVADISKMPALVTKMFALPKMKKYSFKMALDREGSDTKDWPRQDGHATLMKLNSLSVTEVIYLKTEEDIKKALTAVIGR